MDNSSFLVKCIRATSSKKWLCAIILVGIAFTTYSAALSIRTLQGIKEQRARDDRILARLAAAEPSVLCRRGSVYHVSFGRYTSGFDNAKLIHLRDLPELESVWFERSPLTDSDLRFLDSHSHLKEILFVDIPLGTNAIERLRKKLPNTKISLLK